jgi:hypothetical protein
MPERCCGSSFCPCCGGDVAGQGGRPTLCPPCAAEAEALKATTKTTTCTSTAPTTTRPAGC